MRLFRSARWLLLTLLIPLIPASSHAQIVISVGFAPPELPVYEQPFCSQPNLMWAPGYWAYGDGTTTGFPALGFRLLMRAPGSR